MATIMKESGKIADVQIICKKCGTKPERNVKLKIQYCKEHGFKLGFKTVYE